MKKLTKFEIQIFLCGREEAVFRHFGMALYKHQVLPMFTLCFKYNRTVWYSSQILKFLRFMKTMFIVVIILISTMRTFPTTDRKGQIATKAGIAFWKITKHLNTRLNFADHLDSRFSAEKYVYMYICSRTKMYIF